MVSTVFIISIEGKANIYIFSYDRRKPFMLCLYTVKQNVDTSVEKKSISIKMGWDDFFLCEKFGNK